MKKANTASAQKRVEDYFEDLAERETKDQAATAALRYRVARDDLRQMLNKLRDPDAIVALAYAMIDIGTAVGGSFGNPQVLSEHLARLSRDQRAGSMEF